MLFIFLLLILFVTSGVLAVEDREDLASLVEGRGFAYSAWVETTAHRELERIAGIHAAFQSALDACPEWQFYCVGSFDGEVSHATMFAVTHGILFTSSDVAFSKTSSRLFSYIKYLPEGEFVARRAALKTLVSDARLDSVPMRGLFKRRSLRAASAKAQDVIDDVVCSNLRCGKWEV